MELGKFENSRTFHAPKGNQKVIRDVNPVQVTKLTPPTPKEKPQIEIKMSGEPSLEKVTQPISKSKKHRRTNRTHNEKS